MINQEFDLVVLGLSITSSWGNGHATTYRSLLRAFAARGHSILFLERDVPWYRENRDFTECDYCSVQLYAGIRELRDQWADVIRDAPAVIVGSYVPDGIEVGEWVLENAGGVKAFYDIDTPITLEAVKADTCAYLNRSLIPRYDLYLSFSGGPVLNDLERSFGSPRAEMLACSVDPGLYYPEETSGSRWDLAYLGTYSEDRQPRLNTLLLEPASLLPGCRFAVAGPQYPDNVRWPSNVERIEHLPPALHREFYNAQRFTLNITRKNMVETGYSPSVRLFEAAACGTPIVSDYWPGLESFFSPGLEILVAESANDCYDILTAVTEQERRAIARRACARVHTSHTAAHRAEQMEAYLASAAKRSRQGRSISFTTAVHT